MRLITLRFCVFFVSAVVSGCTFVASPVAVVPRNKGTTPVQAGEYQIMERSGSTGPWRLVQTGWRLDVVEDHYSSGFTDEAVSFVPDGIGIVGLRDSLAFAIVFDSGVPPRSPQQKFLSQKRGAVLMPLTDEFFVVQTPLTFALEEFPEKQAATDGTAPGWALGVVRKVDNRSWEYSLCLKCRDASVALFGGTPNCDADGKCVTVASVSDFGQDPEKNIAILRKAAQDFALEPALKLIRVGP